MLLESVVLTQTQTTFTLLIPLLNMSKLINTLKNINDDTKLTVHGYTRRIETKYTLWTTVPMMIIALVIIYFDRIFEDCEERIMHGKINCCDKKWSTVYVHCSRPTFSYHKIIYEIEWTNCYSSFKFGMIYRANLDQFNFDLPLGAKSNRAISHSYFVSKSRDQITESHEFKEWKLFGMKYLEGFGAMNVFVIQFNMETSRILVKVRDGDTEKEIGYGPILEPHFLFAVSVKGEKDILTLSAPKYIEYAESIKRNENE